ncbi:hypothetical protein SMCF_7139, partial [Streptomyces coelicoflavus ZG0656]
MTTATEPRGTARTADPHLAGRAGPLR